MTILNAPNLMHHYIKENAVDRIINDSLIKACELCQFEQGETILVANDEMRHFYFFVKGKLKIFQVHENGRSLLIQFYSQFDSLGEVELMNDVPGSCSVMAVTQSHLIRIPFEVMNAHGVDYPPFLRYLIQSLSYKLLAADKHHSYNLLYPVKNRLASYLKAHENAFGEIQLHESLQEVSEYIGTTYRQLHRAFLQLQKEGVIQKCKKNIQILNDAALTALAARIYQDK